VVVAAVSQLPMPHLLAVAAQCRRLLCRALPGQVVPLLEQMAAQLSRLRPQRSQALVAAEVELSLLVLVVLVVLEQAPVAVVAEVVLLTTALPQEPVERVTMAPYSSSVNRTRRV